MRVRAPRLLDSTPESAFDDNRQSGLTTADCQRIRRYVRPAGICVVLILVLSGSALSTAGNSNHLDLAAPPVGASSGVRVADSPTSSGNLSDASSATFNNPVFGVQCYINGLAGTGPNGSVGSALLWTPIAMLNAPLGGSAGLTSSASEKATFSEGALFWIFTSSTTNSVSWGASVAGGETLGEFEVAKWETFLLHNQTIVGYGYPCKQKFYSDIAAISPGPPAQITLQATPQAYSNGATSFTRLDSFTGRTLPSVVFDYYWATSNYSGEDLCSSNSGKWVNLTTTSGTVSQTGIDVSVSVTIQGVISIGTTLLDFSSSVSTSSANSYSYYFPPGGIWGIDSLLSAGSPGGFAFWRGICGTQGGNGGGGCIASGTYVYTASGWVEVQNLTAGDTVYGWSWITGNFTNETIRYLNSSSQKNITKINGDLYLTSVNQPMYVRTPQFLGWVLDPQNLTTGDQYFDPYGYQWVNITSVHSIHSSTTVYDLRVYGLYNFVVREGNHYAAEGVKTPNP